MYELQDIGGDLHDSNLQCAFAIQSKFLKYAHLQGGSSISCNQIPQYQYLHLICLSPLKTTYIFTNHQKGEIVTASSVP